MTLNSDLLRPSLSPGRDAPTAIYSVRATFFTSFFGGLLGGFVGGPIPAVLITLVNAQRLRRLSREWPLAPAALAVAIALRWAASRHDFLGLQVYLGQHAEVPLAAIASLAFFGTGYALHAPYHRSQTLLDLPTPNGLSVGILCVVAGWCVERGLVRMIP
jgi:hypothetical protein